MISRQASLGYRVRVCCGNANKTKYNQERACACPCQTPSSVDTIQCCTLKNAALQMGDKYRKTPLKDNQKTKTKVLCSGHLPHPSRYPLQAKTLPHLLCTLTRVPCTHLSGVPEDTHLQRLYHQQHQLLTYQASGSSVGTWVRDTRRAGTSRGH